MAIYLDDNNKVSIKFTKNTHIKPKTEHHEE
jgi:hypothetical protein